MGQMLIAPAGWTLSSYDNIVKGETVFRLHHAKFGRGFEYVIPQDRLDAQSEGERLKEMQQWIWMVTGEKPPTPNPQWQTPAAKAALAKAMDTPLTVTNCQIVSNSSWTGQPTPKPKVEEEPTLPPGITRHIELE
jgi:hypothetical protein